MRSPRASPCSMEGIFTSVNPSPGCIRGNATAVTGITTARQRSGCLAHVDPVPCDSYHRESHAGLTTLEEVKVRGGAYDHRDDSHGPALRLSAARTKCVGIGAEDGDRLRLRDFWSAGRR